MRSKDPGYQDQLLITSSTFPASADASGPRFILDLGIALSKHYQVTVLAPHSPGALTREVIEGVAIRRYRYFWPTSLERLVSSGGMREAMAASWLARFQVPFFLLAQLLSLVKTCAELQPIAVNSHWLVPQGLVTSLSRFITHVPHLLHLHAADVFFVRRLFAGPAIARFIINRSDSVLVSGSHLVDLIDGLIGRESEAQVRSMGVWTSRFSVEPEVKREDPVVLFVGRLVEKKGVGDLLKAFEIVLGKLPRATLRIVGSGPLREFLDSEINRRGLSSQVELTGGLDHPGVRLEMSRADLLCTPSIVDSRGETEGMPTVILEAMASGLPVVATRVAGTPDVVRDRENGWLAEPSDPVGLAKTIIEALKSELRTSVIHEARLTAEQHDWSNVADAYIKTIRGIQN